jgi:hypothetical protein
MWTIITIVSVLALLVATYRYNKKHGTSMIASELYPKLNSKPQDWDKYWEEETREEMFKTNSVINVHGDISFEDQLFWDD